MNNRILSIFLILCALFSESDGKKQQNVPPDENLDDSLSFIDVPALFQPLGVRFTQPTTVNFSQLAYFDLESRPFEVLPSAPKEEWRRVATKSGPLGVNLEFGCEWLTATGLYRIRAVDGNETFQSPVIRLDKPRHGDAPKLLMREDSIFPHCQHDFDLSWSLPNCTLERRAAAETFRIRLSAVQADGMEIYMGELRPTVDPPHRLGIPCAHFDIIYVEFCFELLSVQPYTNQLDMWDRRCLSTEPVLHVDGVWSEWGSWSSCSRSCGNGRRKRKRECNNPKPQTGRFCQGKMMESEACNKEKCPKIPPSPTPFLDTSKQRECQCGCTLANDAGALHILSNLNCGNETTAIKWTIPSRFLARVRVVFIGNLNGDEKLSITEEGGQEMFKLNGKSARNNPTIAMFPLDSDLLIEFHLDREHKSAESGLIVDYEVIPAPQPSSDGNEYSVLIGSRFVSCQSKKCHAVMTILSLLVCLVTIMALVAVPPLICSFIARRRIQTRKRRANNLLASMRAESEMVRSGGTDSTQLSSSNHSASKPPVPPARESNGAVPSDPTTNHSNHHPYSNHLAHPPQPVTKRSVGVQQSAQTTPRQLRSTIQTPCPTASIASMDLLEYDYYDPIVPGSMLRPIGDGEIDIEKIIEMETSGWLHEPTAELKAEEN